MAFDGSAIDQLLDQAVASGAFHGVAAMVVDADSVMYEHAAGESNAETIYRNASMTKAVATTAALQLLEQRRLQLDATVESVLPEFGELQVIDGFDGEGQPLLRAPASKPTIRQLMNHTSGLGYFFLNEKLLRLGGITGMPSPIEGKKVALKAPLVHDPGTVWEYGVSTDWLGLVVEQITGQRLGEYVAEHIYKPLGMADSTFNLESVPPDRLLPIRLRAADGTLQPTEIDLPRNAEWDAGGHGSLGTIQDYARFIRAWLRDGELDGARILSPETVALAFEDHLAGATLPEVMRSLVPELANDVPALPVPQGWGLGFHFVSVDIPGMRSAGTGDWAGLFNSYYWIDRAAGLGGVIMTQILPFFDAQVVEALLGFEVAAYAQLAALTA
jgi:methyl acetate hydrolase